MLNEIYISTSAFQEEILDRCSSPSLDSIRKIEFSGGRFIGYEKTVTEIERLLREGVTSVLIHNYFPIPERSFVLNFASDNPDVLERSFSLAERALTLCSRFGVPYYSFHPGYLGDGYEGPDGHFGFSSAEFATYPRALERFTRSIHRLLEMGRAKGVAIAVENLFPAPGNVRTSLNCSMEEVEELLCSLPEEVGLLVDLAHLNITAHYLGIDRSVFVDFLLERFSRRIVELHLSGNNGLHDEHLPIAPGDWQLDALKGFSSCPGLDGKGVNITLESRRLDPVTLNASKARIEDSLRTGKNQE
ncbi:MAG: sugar phosphate isomerase/epimerase [Desulfobacteraceae bacterium]|nr:MAG: sugar phosphate isomerase/epimerase [Desulfobacteraceae bacterium]